MFDCIEPGEGGENSKSRELIEGCPVVDLHDAATHLQIILKAMERLTVDAWLTKTSLQQFPPSVLRESAAFCRLCFLTLGGKVWHRIFCAFDLRVARRISSSNTLSLFQGITGGDPHNFLVMNLSHDMDLKSPLPLAMYQCAVSCPLDVIVNGYGFQGSQCSLSPANLRSWILMKSTLEQDQIRLAQSLRVSNNCVVKSSCAAHPCRLWSDAVTARQPFGHRRQEWEKLFCAACKANLEAWRNAEIQKTWKQIPAAFGFGSWVDVVKNDTDNFPSRQFEWREQLRALIAVPRWWYAYIYRTFCHCRI